ncbi:MAG: transporter substrate-binding protein [Clostridia bacterium]|jgi:iron(III) transport system substrate-binding protein|nr:transporter substrate-binding protein [Clostridia bacterium]
MRKWLVTALVCLTAMSLTACGTEGKTEVQEPQEAVKEVSAVAEQQEETPKEEEKKLSGKVVVYCPSPAGLADKMASQFTEKTGVEVEMFQGTTGEILARLEAEKENPVADVVIMASWADGLNMIKEDNVLSCDLENGDKVYKDWVDAEHKIYGYSASAMGVIYNTTMLPELSADWSELGSNPAYKESIAIPDPLKSGSCKDFLTGYVNAFGEDAKTIIDSWVSNGITIPGANKAALEAVTTGEKGILIAGVDYNAYSSIAKGEPLNIYYPESGTVINPRPAMILKTSKNVDNAKAFMAYLISDDGQKLVGDAYLLPGRSDIKTEMRTNVEDIPVFDLDWSWMMEHSEEVADHLVNQLK